ncbi:MAG TPA: ferric reductase-like transmembrane domain-containing protein [Anaerolineales bacterium]|nr:ferric reductase-like transmembrane domain-containing protein [Anaerolineales bacterium]
MRKQYLIQGIFWILIYLLLVSAPLIILLIGEVPEGREFWRELSVALGFAGLAMMSLQFVLTARFKAIKAPYGADIVYHFHRQVSLVGFVLIVAHPLLLFVFSPDTLALLNLFSAPWRARAGVSAVLLLMALIAMSLWRKRFKIEYTTWRIWHGVLAVVVVALAIVHVVLARHYLNTPWKQGLWIAYGVFWVGLLFYVRVLKPLQLLRRPYQVDSVTPERGNAWSLTVTPIGHQGMHFQPGQFAWISVWNSPFSEAEHPFSFSSSANCPDKLTFTIKELGDFTREIKNLQPGQKVYVDGPFGHFSVDRHVHAEQFVFIAGGVGITPIMSMLRTLAERGEQRRLTLFYSNRDWESVIFREEIEHLKGALNLKVVYVLEKPPAEWDGERGYLSQAILEQHLPEVKKRNTLEVFICGPQPMLNAVEQALVNLRVPFGDFHSERFNLV